MSVEIDASLLPDLEIPPCKYEYLDHTADIQLHAWGDSLEEAFTQCAMAMFNSITQLEYVQIKQAQEIDAEADDMLGLLFHFLDEFLYHFSAEYFIPRIVKIIEFDRENFRIRAVGYGEEFQIGKHPQGHDVKAITYSNMQVHEHDDKDTDSCEVFVIIDV